MAKTLDEHYGYLADGVKLSRYRAALERLVQPGHVVLDLGCGTGLLGLMALRAGASEAWFVEEGAVIEAARRSVTAAGFADRATFFATNSFELELPGRVDLVVCDHVGYFGFDYGILALLADARERFLKPGGRLIPEGIEPWLAPVESADCRRLVGQWLDGSVPADYAWLGTAAANTKHAVQLATEALLAAPATLASLELGAAAAPFLSWSTTFRCERDGILDGVAGGFDCRLAGDIHISNSPAAKEPLARPQAFLPLDEPVAVRAGDEVRATVMARHLDHVIGWVIELPGAGRRFTHTTFNGLLLDRSALARNRPDRVARLNERGRARQLVLSYCDGARSLATVQDLIEREHPRLFPSAQAARAFVTQVLAWDTGE